MEQQQGTAENVVAIFVVKQMQKEQHVLEEKKLCPHSPAAGGASLKTRTGSVRIRLGALQTYQLLTMGGAQRAKNVGI